MSAAAVTAVAASASTAAALVLPSQALSSAIPPTPLPWPTGLASPSWSSSAYSSSPRLPQIPPVSASPWLPSLPSSQELSTWWFTLVPQPIRFLVSGNLGSVCLYGLERWVAGRLLAWRTLLPPLVWLHRATVSYLVGYFLHLLAQHFLHSWLVYGLDSINTVDKYTRTLGAVYASYLNSAVGSACLHTALLQQGLDATAAFLMTLALFSCINYFIMSWIVQSNNNNKNSDPSTTTASTATTAPGYEARLEEESSSAILRYEGGRDLTKPTTRGSHTIPLEVVRGGASFYPRHSGRKLPSEHPRLAWLGQRLFQDPQERRLQDWIRSLGPPAAKIPPVMD